MEVRLGWSGEIQGTWTKMDVLVEEVDLRSHLIEAGAQDVDSLKITPPHKFKLLYAMAELFVALHKMSRYPEYFGTESDQENIRKLIASRDTITQEILSREAPF